MATSENVRHFQYDDNFKSSSGAGFDAKYVDEGLWVVHKALGKTPETLCGSCVNDLRLIKPHIGLGLGKACSLI
jgi:hypothetical protein